MAGQIDVSAATTKAVEQAKLAGISQVGMVVEHVTPFPRASTPHWKVHIRAGGIIYTCEISMGNGKVLAWHRGY